MMIATLASSQATLQQNYPQHNTNSMDVAHNDVANSGGVL